MCAELAEERCCRDGRKQGCLRAPGAGCGGSVGLGMGAHSESVFEEIPSTVAVFRTKLKDTL